MTPEFQISKDAPTVPPWAIVIGKAATEVVLYLAYGMDQSERRHAATVLADLFHLAQRVSVLREGEAREA